MIEQLTSPNGTDTIELDHQLVAHLAGAWVERLTRQLSDAGRRLEGGWPGTLSEARSLLTLELAAPPIVDISRPRFEGMAKAIYKDAKTMWLARADKRPRAQPEDS